MKPFLVLGSVFLILLTKVCFGQHPPNLVPDASFESPVAAWFDEEGRGSYFAGKALVTDAPDGKYVLDLRGWEKDGSRILSPAFDLTTSVYSGTINVRSFGKVDGATVELALFDEKGQSKLASFGTLPVDRKGQWTKLQGAGVKLVAAAPRGKLAIVVGGPQRGARVEVDQVGLFAGGALAAVTDNADFTWFEAEKMADGKGWKAREDFPYWYNDKANDGKMLSGSDPVAPSDNDPVSHAMVVRFSGPHRLWVRLLHVTFDRCTIAVQQNGKVVSSCEVKATDPNVAPPGESWGWVSLDANLAAGEAQIVLTRPDAEATGIARKIDVLALTNLLDYKPEIQDFRPKGYIRFTNRSDPSVEPFCLFVGVFRMQPPQFYSGLCMLSAAGSSDSYYAPADKTKWFASGDSSSWVNISRVLLPGGGHNNITILATRQMRTAGLVTNPWRGTVEFAVGDEHRIVKRVDIDQASPRVLLTAPYDFEHQGDEIYTAFDYIRREEKTLDKIGEPHGRVATNLDLNVILTFETAMDDPRVIDGEIDVIKRLGFNGTYTPITDPKDAVAFYARHGLKHFGIWSGGWSMKNDCFSEPNVEAMDAGFQAAAKQFAPILDKIERNKLADEPGGPSYEQIAANPRYREAFTGELKTQGLTPRDFGVTDWNEVVPVLPAEKEKHPELFYYTGLFRLNAFASFARACIREKRKYLPANLRCYINYSPPYGDYLSWDQLGADPFLAQRGGGFEMGWSEDWLAYGAGPQQASVLWAVLRCAGAPMGEPLGGYDVGGSGGPLLQQFKFYELLAAGARHIDFYNYGPYYTSIDSWGARYEIYPVLSKVLHEAGVIDAALKDTTRQKTDIAILYNRTAGIWANKTATSEQNSYFTHWALAHAGYDAHFIPEEDVEAGKLNAYRVLYIDGPQLQPAAAAQIADWVRRGGVLFGAAGAGSRDQFNRPSPILEPVFGAQSKNLKLEHDAGRPKYELRSQPVLDELTSVEGAPPVSFDQLCFRETLVPREDATVILKNKNGEAAGVMNHFGQGVAIRVAAVPGITYIHDAVRDKDYDTDSYMPKKFNPTLRDFIAWPATLAKAARVAAEITSTAIPEIVRYDGKDRAVVFIIDHNAEPISKFIMNLPHASQFNRAWSATGHPVQLRRLEDDAIEVSLFLDITDAVVLEKIP